MTPPADSHPAVQPGSVQRSCRPVPGSRPLPDPTAAAAGLPVGPPVVTVAADSGGWDYGDPTCTWLG